MNEMAASDPSSLAPTANDPFHRHLRRVHDPNLDQEAPSVVQMAASDPSCLAPTAQNLFRCDPQHVLGPNLVREAPSIVPMAASYPLCLTLAARDPYVLDPNLDRAALSYQAPASLDSSYRHCRLAHGPNLDLVDLSRTATVLLPRSDSCPPDPYRHSLRPDLYPTLDDRGVHHCSRPEDGDVYSRGRCRSYPLPSHRPSWRRSPSSPRRRARLPRPLRRERAEDDYYPPLPTAAADCRIPCPHLRPPLRGDRSGPYRTAGPRSCCCHCCSPHRGLPSHP